jgi:hypothetical protein
MLLLFIIIIIILIFVYIISTYKHKESFTSNISFVDKNYGREILNKTTYLKELTKYDYIARNLENVDNIEEYYCANIMEFSSEDKHSMRWLVDEMLKLIPEKYRFMLNNIKICKLAKSIEMGFPHTHGDTIFISEHFINKLNKYYRESKVIDAIKNIGITLIHEQVHVLQRENPYKFKDLYENYWNFVYNNREIVGLDNYKIYNRSNPDGLDISWLLKLDDDTILCMAVYKQDEIRLDNVEYIGVFLRKDKSDNKLLISKVELLYNITSFNDYFNININHYHPNEISAELISNYYGYLMGIINIDLTSPAIKKLILWLDNINLI